MGNGLSPSNVMCCVLTHLQHGNRSGEWTFTLKCNVLRVSRAKSPMTFSYRLKGTVLAEEATSKYLGVDLQNNLSWNQHVSRVTKKANRILRFLRRNLRKASEETKAQAYMSMVRSNIDYCSTVWNLHQRDQNYQVEMVQGRAA